MTKIAEQLHQAGHLTDEQLERIGENVHEFIKAAQADPGLAEEFLKEAGLMGETTHAMRRMVPQLLGGMALVGGAGLVAGGVSKAYEEIKSGVMKARRYETMIKENPQLKNFNAKQVQKAFNTLNRFNPNYAADPLVAGTFVRNAVEQERVDIQSVNSLVQSKALQDKSGPPPFSPQQMVKAPIFEPREPKSKP